MFVYAFNDYGFAKGRLGVLQVFVLAEMINCLGAYGLPLNLAYLLQKKLTFKYLFVFQLNYPISYLWTRMLL
jgi:hypothetical protein